MKGDLESSSGNKKIQLESETQHRNQAIQNNPNQESVTEKNNPSFFKDPKQAMANKIVEQAAGEIKSSWYEKLLNFSFLHKYFSVTTTNVLNRLFNAIIPFNYKFHELIHDNPDIYGPFWIYTTLVFVIAAAGSITQIFSDTTDTAFFQTFVPVAAAVIYGIGFIIPIVLYVLMSCFGTETTFVLILCIFGYSFTIYLPAMAICAVPFDWLQWVLIAYSVVSSCGFLIVNFWKELSKYLENRRYIILGIIIGFEVALFFFLKLYFFDRMRKVVNLPPTITPTSNSTNSTNKLLLDY